MTIIEFKKNDSPLGQILKLGDDAIVISLGNQKITIKNIIELMSKLIFSNMYSSNTIQIPLLEYLEKDVIEAQIKCFYIFQHKPLNFKTNKDLENRKFELIHSESLEIKNLIKKNKTIVKFLNEIKDLIELPPELIYPESLLKYILDFSERNKLNVLKIYDEQQLSKEGFGGILSVGKGSHNPPKMAILEWNGTNNKNEKPIVLVGKGVTYDSGGYSIKTDPYMKNMKRDKTGVCIILGLMGILAKLNMNIRVIAILPMAENVISSKSYKPDEIIHSYSKKTIEVYNTDAEGRLLLMDGITLGLEYEPKIIIDVATLTAVGTFCGHYGAIFSNNNDIAWQLQKSGEKVGERFWVLPLFDELIEDAQDTKMANVKNDGYQCYSTTTMGAAFLANFVKNDIPWIHIDLGESQSMYEKYNKKNINTTNSFLMILEFLSNFNQLY